MASFDENGKYIKTNWKAGDKITATKLNKIEESIEAVNDNDISRHVEADARLDALEAKDIAHDKEFTNVRTLIADNKAAAELGDYDINSRMQFLEEELNEGIEEVHNVASTVDGKIAQAEADMTAQVIQGKADMEAMVNEVESEMNELQNELANLDASISSDLQNIKNETKYEMDILENQDDYDMSYTLPGGIIIKTGVAEIEPNQGNLTAFNSSFPTQCISVLATMLGGAMTTETQAGFMIVFDNDGFYLRHVFSEARKFTYIAIGY